MIAVLGCIYGLKADQLFKQLSMLGYVRDHTNYYMNMYIIITLTDIILCIELDNI